MEETLLELRDLEVRFGARPVLEGLSLRVGRGEKVTLTGPSGSGKSTILRCLLGFVVPAAGEVRIEGRRLDGTSVWELRGRLAWVGQEPELGEGRVQEVLERPFHYRRNAGQAANLARTTELCERFGLAAGLLQAEMGDLSGGEKQRVAIVSAILLERPIMLLDEASSALDRVSRAAVAEWFRSRRELTVLSVAHDPDRFDLGGRVLEPDGLAIAAERT